ncbi:MAG: FtsQ-type POTRA domain-containing protein [Capsulimonas sp.]|uniref:cell division protein FtsQ/DivIB n=1 Tax=Capsulimonas sp. TaxID=2494211 RepID=UPI003265353D
MHKRTHTSQTGRIVVTPPGKRRVNRRRRNWHRTIRRVCAVALVVEAACLLLANPYLRVTHVRIEGLQTLPADQIFSEAQVPKKTNIFLMAARQPFVKRLQVDPVIDHVSRAIELPHTLVLRVVERQPYTVLSANGGYYVLDRKRVPFRLVETPPTGVPVLALEGDMDPSTLALGKPIGADWLVQSYKLIALLGAKKNLEAKSIKVDQNANLCLNRSDNLQIKLGQPEELPAKLAVAQETVTAAGENAGARIAYIDVSCPSQPALMPRPQSRPASR